MQNSKCKKGDGIQPTAFCILHFASCITRLRLEHIMESQDEVLPVTAPERPFDAKEGAIDRSESEPDAVIVFEVLEIDVFGARAQLARVVEDIHDSRREDFPPVLALQQQRVLVAETEDAEAAEIVGAAERPLQIERHLVSRVSMSAQ